MGGLAQAGTAVVADVRAWNVAASTPLGWRGPGISTRSADARLPPITTAGSGDGMVAGAVRISIAQRSITPSSVASDPSPCAALLRAAPSPRVTSSSLPRAASRLCT